jgi:transposase
MTEEPNLKQKGLTCKKIDSFIRKNDKDSKRDFKDANELERYGLGKQAIRQNQIAKAQQEQVEALKQIKRQLCPLK